METRDPAQLLAAAADGLTVYLVVGTTAKQRFQFDRFTDHIDGLKCDVSRDEASIRFPGGGTVRVVTLAAVQQGGITGDGCPIVAAHRYYHPHELDDYLPVPHGRVDWC